MNTKPRIQIDSLTATEISGWFYDPTNKLGKKINVLANGKMIGSVDATIERTDVAKALNCDSKCGFTFKFHKPLKGNVKISMFSGSDKETLIGEALFEGAQTLSHSAEPDGDKNIYFDVSDLVYFVGHHDNLTGIQRVQSCIILSIIRDNLHPANSTKFLSYDNRKNEFIVLDSTYFVQLLEDLFLPQDQRTVYFDRIDARLGVLPNSSGMAANATKQNVVCLLGAAWVNQDYFARILDLKRTHGFRFVMTVHDLIPIYASETCDQGTTKVFKKFLNQAYRYTDAFLSVSENTARDIHKYANRIGITPPPVHVAKNGSHFNDFIPEENTESIDIGKLGVKGKYVLFVSTIEGRKNHQLMFEVWRNMIKAGVDVPTLVCVGRNGWRAEEFLNNLVSTNYLDNKIKLLADISDAELARLYQDCLFTVYPSLYEGWGLPVGESLAKGKICVTCMNSSLPEVAGKYGVYIDPNDATDATVKIQELVTDESSILRREKDIAENYINISWSEVANNTIKAALGSFDNAALNVHANPKLGKEYCFGTIPELSGHQFGDSIVNEIENIRKLPISREFASDDRFVTGNELRRGKKWHAPEQWGCWAGFGAHQIAFQIDPAHRSPTGYILYLTLHLPHLLVGERISYSIEGRTVYAEISRSSESIIKLNIDMPSDLKASKQEVIVLTGNISASQQKIDELMKIDTRLLGIGYKSFMLIANEDSLTRMSILENLMTFK